MQTLNFDDIGYTVIVKPGEAVCDFSVYSILGMVDNTPAYVDPASGSAICTELDKAQPFMTGRIKWDGCSDWWFIENSAALHFCGRGDFAQFSELMERLHDVAAENIKENEI